MKGHKDYLIIVIGLFLFLGMTVYNTMSTAQGGNTSAQYLKIETKTKGNVRTTAYYDKNNQLKKFEQREFKKNHWYLIHKKEYANRQLTRYTYADIKNNKYQTISQMNYYQGNNWYKKYYQNNKVKKIKYWHFNYFQYGINNKAFTWKNFKKTPPKPVATFNKIHVRYINKLRIDHKRKPLKLNATLSKAASIRTHEMIKYNKFSHTRPNNKPWYTAIFQAGYKDYQALGENIALNYESPKSVNYAMYKQWYNSKGHRENMLSKSFDEVGISIIKGKDGSYWGAQIFGKN